MINVNSSAITAIGYDSENQVLDILFKSDRKYSYAGVNIETYENFMKAESKGKFFNYYIKNCYLEV